MELNELREALTARADVLDTFYDPHDVFIEHRLRQQQRIKPGLLYVRLEAPPQFECLATALPPRDDSYIIMSVRVTAWFACEKSTQQWLIENAEEAKMWTHWHVSPVAFTETHCAFGSLWGAGFFQNTCETTTLAAGTFVAKARHFIDDKRHTGSFDFIAESVRNLDQFGVPFGTKRSAYGGYE